MGRIVNTRPMVEAEEAEHASRLPTLSAEDWLKRDLPEPEFVLGNVFTTTSRNFVIAPTGLGKTNFCLAMAASISAGVPFLHWAGTGRPKRVLYIDGEMSNRLAKRRIKDATKRLGHVPKTLLFLCFDDLETPYPLTTPEGRAIIEAQIARMGGVDFIVFDSIMALIGGDMKDEESWSLALPWILSLTKRSIGMAWVHHTGIDEGRGYGSKTREWLLDNVMLLERAEHPGTDMVFNLKFKKARERTPENRDEFADVKVALVNDAWEYESSAPSKPKGRMSPKAFKFLTALKDALVGENLTCFQGWPAVTMERWKAECITQGLIDKDTKPASARSLMSKYRLELLAANMIGCNGDLVWLQ